MCTLAEIDSCPIAVLLGISGELFWYLELETWAVILVPGVGSRIILISDRSRWLSAVSSLIRAGGPAVGLSI